MTGDPAEIPIPEALRTQYRVSFIRFQSPTAALFEGVDPEHGRTVLVKVMRPDPTASPADRQRVRRELQKLVQVRHPVLVPVLDLGEEAGLTWIIRPFVVGETLAERISARGRLSPDEAATLGLHLAAGLGELHRHGLLHRDLRPGHVLLGHDGGVYLIDAGLGRTLVAPDGRALVGCPGYAAPEAILGRLMSFRSDLYGLGAVLYEALSGMPPYMALDPRRMMQLQCEADPEPLDPSVPPALNRLVATLLARDPRERPMSAQVVERQLEPMVPSTPSVPPEGDIELGERTVMTDPADGLLGPVGPVYEAPSPAFRVPPPSPAFRVPTPAPAFRAPTPAPVFQVQPPPGASGQGFKQTMMGLAPDVPTGGAGDAARDDEGAAAPSLPAEFLDFDDVVDTNQNEASRMFGIPVAAHGSGGSAIPPLSPEAPVASEREPVGATMGPFARYGQAPAADPKSGPRMAPPFGDGPMAPVRPASGAHPLPSPPVPPEPEFAPPASHTVAMDAPPPAVFANYGPQGPPMHGQPMQGQPPWSPHGPGMGDPGPGPMESRPAPPKSRTPALLLGLLGLVAIAGGGGYLAARARRAPRPISPPAVLADRAVTPEQAASQPSMPTAPPAEPDAGAQVAAVGALPSEAAPTAPVVPPTPAPVVVAAPVAPTPRPAPVARVGTPRPVNVRPVAAARSIPAVRPAATTPLTEAIRRQDWAGARRLLTDSLRARPNDAAAHAQLGYVLDRLGDSAGSLSQYRTATRLDRRNTRYLHRLADLQLATGDRAGAVATLQQILRINPAEPAARGRLDQLQGAR